MAQKSLHWFRQDLRLNDNPALAAAAAHGRLLPVFILDTTGPEAQRPGAASRVWLRAALADLNEQLGGCLRILEGDPERLITDLIAEYDIDFVSWNRLYDAHSISRDTRLKSNLKSKSITVESYNGSLLWEPWEIHKNDGTAYKVFTQFYNRGCLAAAEPRRPRARLRISCQPNSAHAKDVPLNSLSPKQPWDKEVLSGWDPTAAGGQNLLAEFLSGPVAKYADTRNLPAEIGTSMLAPYLHFGQISPNEIWYACETSPNSAAPFKRQLGWREFSTHLLYHIPTLPDHNLNRSFDHFPWRAEHGALVHWQRGQTGIPFVDAAMRELWQTGYMHNRLRMVVASFLVKNLRIHWRTGAAWFWDTLFDADLANNSASWQWVAGSGADAAPYFRIFNPVTQGQKFDPAGAYTCRYVPELKDLPNKYLFAPWEAPESVLEKAGVTLGQTYPHPIVDLKESRTAALGAYQYMRNAQ